MEWLALLTSMGGRGIGGAGKLKLPGRAVMAVLSPLLCNKLTCSFSEGKGEIQAYLVI